MSGLFLFWFCSCLFVWLITVLACRGRGRVFVFGGERAVGVLAWVRVLFLFVVWARGCSLVGGVGFSWLALRVRG